MMQLPFIEVLLSIVFIFFILCLAVSGIVELWRKLYKKRGRTLHAALEKVLNDPQNKNWNDLFYNHPQIETLRKTLKSYPSYISAETFSATLIDLIADEGVKENVVQNTDGKIKFERDNEINDSFLQFKQGLDSLSHSSFKRLLISLTKDADSISTLKHNISQWFNGYMDRVTGWYKWSAKRTTLKVAIIVTLLFNIDSLSIVNELVKNKELRDNIAENTTQVMNDIQSLPLDSTKKHHLIKKDAPIKVIVIQDSAHTIIDRPILINEDTNILAEIERNMESIKSFLASNNLPFGWKTRSELGMDKDASFCELIQMYWKEFNKFQLLGWIITTLALTFGAPFWFEIMGKIVNVRNSGLKPRSLIQKSKG